MNEAARKHRVIFFVGLVLIALAWIYCARVVPSFFFNLPHERDLTRAFLSRGWSHFLWGPEIETFRLFGGGYYALLSLGALFAGNALVGSAVLAVLLHFATVFFLFSYFYRKSMVPSACVGALLLSLSSSFEANLMMLWNPSFLPFFLLAALIFTYEAMAAAGRVRIGWLAGALFFWAMCVQIHALALLNAFGVLVFIFYRRYGVRAIVVGLAIPVLFFVLIYFYGLRQAGPTLVEQVSFHVGRLFSVPDKALSFSSFRQTLITLKLFMDPAILIAATLTFLVWRRAGLSDLGKLACFSAICALPLLIYAIQRYVEDPAAFRHRYYIFFLIPIVLATADACRAPLGFRFAAKWAWAASLLLLAFSVLLIREFWVAGVWEGLCFLGLVFSLSSLRRFFSPSTPLFVFAGALFLWRFAFSSTQSALPDRQFQENIRISQVREFAGWVRETEDIPMRSLRERIILVGFGNLSALWLQGSRSADPAANTAYVFWNKRPYPAGTRLCGSFASEIGRRHDLVGKLLEEGRFSLASCRESEGSLLAVLAPVESRGWTTWFGNYGTSDIPSDDERSGAGPIGYVEDALHVSILEREPEKYEIVFFGKEISNRYFRGHGTHYLTDMSVSLMCGGRLISEWPAFPPAKRMEWEGRRIFPSGSSLGTDHMVLGPIHFMVKGGGCPRDRIWTEVRWSNLLKVDAFRVREVAPGGSRRAFL